MSFIYFFWQLFFLTVSKLNLSSFLVFEFLSLSKFELLTFVTTLLYFFKNVRFSVQLKFLSQYLLCNTLSFFLFLKSVFSSVLFQLMFMGLVKTRIVELCHNLNCKFCHNLISNFSWHFIFLFTILDFWNSFYHNFS